MRLFCPQRYCTKAVERVRPFSTFFAESTSFPPPFFSLLLLSHVPALPPRKCFSLGSDESSSPSSPFLDCTLCRCLYNGERGGGPSSSARQHSTHLRTSPRMERRRTHPPQPFSLPPRQTSFSPKTSSSSLERGLRSRKRAAEAEEKRSEW